MRPPRRRTRRLPAANPAGNPPLNKPVVSEQALGEPVLVAVTPRLASKAAAAGPAYVVLAGISLSHFLNDTMQSLIASVYPILKDNYALDFAQIGMITLAFQFTASLLQPLVGHFTDRKAAAVLVRHRHGLHLLRIAAAQRRAHLSDHSRRGVVGRPWFGDIPSRIGADRTAGIRRPLRFCAIGVPARRQLWHLDGAGAGRPDRGAVRPALDRLVFLDRLSRDRHPVADRRLVQAADRDQEVGRGPSGTRTCRIRVA